jgi:hypothetical protein
MTGFKRASDHAARRAAIPRRSRHLENHDIAKDPFCDGSEIASAEGLPALSGFAVTRCKSGLLRGFSHSWEAKSMKVWMPILRPSHLSTRTK